MAEKEEILRFPIKLSIELLKHAATKSVGEGATKLITNTVGGTFFKQEDIEEFNQWLDKPQTIKTLNQAIENAENCFREKTKIIALRESIGKLHGLSLVDYPVLLDSLEKWREAPTTTSWNETIYQIFKQDYGNKITEQSLRIASREYEICLRKNLAMLMDDKWTPKITTEAILHNSELLKELEGKLDSLQRILTTSGVRSSIYEAFKIHYLGSEDGRQSARVFGGREKEINLLNNWLQKKSQEFPYAIMTGRAGKGKSALILHWLEQPNKDEIFTDWEVVYYPISSRYGTNREIDIFALLAERLAEIYQIDVNVAQKGIDDRSTVYTLLRRQEIPSGKKILVVIDGLDEAATSQTAGILFPFAAPENVRIIITARSVEESDDGNTEASEVSLRAWAQQLNWKNDWGIYHVNLLGLTELGIAQVLEQMGNPLNSLGSQQEVIKELYRLSEEGEPLIVELYIELLQDQLARQKTITLEDLRTLSPGFDAFFEIWINDQKQLWHGKNRFIEPHVKSLRDFCAFSKGRLGQQDLLWLGKDTFGNDLELIEDAWTVLARFVTRVHGKQTTRYFFSHPKLNDYFQKKSQQQGHSNALNEKFVEYGTYIINALKNGEMKPETVADQHDYILQHYSDHLYEIRVNPTHYYSLITEEWLRSWEALEGTEKGFMRDVDQAWAQAKNDGKNGLYIQILAGLCHASIKTLSTNIGYELLLTLYQRGHLKYFQVINIIEQTPNHQTKLNAYLHCLAITKNMPENEQNNYLLMIQNLSERINSQYDQVIVLLKLADFNSKDKNSRNNFLTSALGIAKQIDNQEQRAEALFSLASMFEGDTQKELYTIAWETIREILNNLSTAPNILGELGKCIPKDFHDEILTSARQMKWGLGRALILHSLVETKEGIAREDLFTEILDALWQISDDDMQFESLFPGLTTNLPENMLESTLFTAQEFSKDYILSTVLEAFETRLPTELHKITLDMAMHLTQDYERATVFLVMYKNERRTSRDKLIENALEATRKVKKYNRIHLYLQIAEASEGEIHETALQEAEDTARLLESEHDQARALYHVAMGQIDEKRTALLQEGFNIAKQITGEQLLGSELSNFAQHLPENMLSDVLEAARQIKNGEYRAKVLKLIAERLPEHLLGDVLNAARSINSDVQCIKIIHVLAKIYTEETQKRLSGEALRLTRQIADNYTRAWLLNELADDYDEEMHKVILNEALTAAQLIDNAIFRTMMLTILHARTGPNLKEKILVDAINSAKEIKNDYQRASQLKRLIPVLPKELIPDVLVLARQISNQQERMNTLLALAIVSDGDFRINILEEVLDLALKAESEYSLFEILQDLADYLPEKFIAKAVKVAEHLESVDNRVVVLCAFAQPFQGNVREEILNNALLATDQIHNNFESRAKSLLALANTYDGEKQKKLFEDTLNETKNITNEFTRGSILQSITKYLPEKLIEAALDIARGINDNNERANTLLAFAAKYDGEMQELILEEVLDIVRAAKLKHENCDFVLLNLAKLGELLPKKLLESILDMAWFIDNEKKRANMLRELVPHLPTHMLGKLFEMIKAFSDLDQTTPLLYKLFIHYNEFLEEFKIGEIEFITEVLDLYKRSTRFTYFVVVGYILQCRRPKDNNIVIDVADAMKLVGQWWP